MGAEILEISRRLERFDDRNTPLGLLRRYANGRIKHFLGRQIMTLSGAVSLILLVSPGVGLLAVAMALTGEAIDCLFLRRVPRMIETGVGFARLYAVSTITAILQSATIAACVCLAWFTAPGEAGMFFSLAYLSGAAVNGGIILPFHMGAALGRLGVYFVTGVGLFLSEIVYAPDLGIGFFYNLLGAVIMGYMVYVFIWYIRAGHMREYRNSRELLARGLELAKANASMQEQQAEMRRLAVVAERALDSVIVSTVDGRIMWVNEAFTRITGYTKDEAIGSTPGELLNGPETSTETSDEIKTAIIAGRSHRTEIVNYTKDGRRIWVETNLAPVFNATGEMEMVIAIERDITEAKRHQEELAKAKLAAEQGERVKADFLASMSHEIRTPMNGIIGMADLLSEARLDPNADLYVKTIRHSAEALLTIINDILDFSKLRAGKMHINPVTFDLRECITSVERLLQPQAQDKDLSLTCDLPAELPHYIRGDDVRLRQVLVNVIGNAIKFTESGGVTVSARCAPSDTGLTLHMDISDTGIGIPADRLEHIFEQFAQADGATTRRFGGTGLGLSISRRLVQRMGGDITVRSTPGQGSCFSIFVPLEEARQAPEKQDDTQPSVSPSQLNGMTILLAEDNKTNRLVISKFLNDSQVRLVTAQDGRQAVELAKEHHPDVILMDMSMPEMDGIDATKAIRKMPCAQPRIIALTANAYQSDKEACLEAGMDAFLSKPVRKVQLIKEIARFAPKPL